MKSKYKIGDKVLIKSKYDPGKDANNYYLHFTSSMLHLYGGKVFEICNIQKVNQKAFNKKVHLPNDGFVYTLKDNFSAWDSSMFEEEF